MKFGICILLLSGIMLFSSCGIQEQKEKLAQKEQALRQKEQELTLKEQELNRREQALNERQKKMDSVLIMPDTLTAKYPNLIGNWTVKMVCTDATCPGSALGDTKVEQWSLGFSNNQVVIKALNNKKQLTRVYTGYVAPDGSLSLTAQIAEPDTSEPLSAQINISLNPVKDGIMSGQREILHPDNCHIVYSLSLKRAD